MKRYKGKKINKLHIFFLSCYSDKPSNEFYSLSCRHRHCLECWRNYLGTNIVVNGSGKVMSCMSRCNQVIDDEQIVKLLSNNEGLRERYQRSLIESFVETNRSTRWCPGNGCTMIVKLKTYTPNYAPMIKCEICGAIFCFQCLEQWHEPMQCSLLRKWERKNRDESQTAKWIITSKQSEVESIKTS